MTTTEAALREARQRLNEYEQMQDAQSQCAPCKLCRGKAIITDAGPGAGYYIRCENSGAFRAAAGCMVSDQRLGGWAYNVMDWWNRLHSQPSPASSTAGEELSYASDDWKLKGYPSAAAEIEDMVNVGRSLMECVAEVVKSSGPFKGWSPADCPTEIVSDMANMIDELTTSLSPSSGEPDHIADAGKMVEPASVAPLTIEELGRGTWHPGDEA